MDDLVHWFGEQLDEDQRIARAAGNSWYGFDPTQQIAFVSPQDAIHIATHSPTQVLREIDAKRRIAELHDYYRSESLSNAPACFLCGPGFGWPCPTMRSLALPYADRPGYREEWRP